MEHKTMLLLTGAGGLVGSFLLEHLNSLYRVMAPSAAEMDITNPIQVHEYLSMHQPEAIIHAAAFTDNNKAEEERGDKRGLCWQTNVGGTKNIVEEAKRTGSFVIFLSTGSVFSGTSKNPGPFIETDMPSKEEDVSWYGWTKSQAEKFVNRGAIIRLSHPVLCKGNRLDYTRNLVALFDNDALYPLFTDQFFSITQGDDVVIAIKKLIQEKTSGIFHVVSEDITTPFELATYAIEKIRYVKPTLKTITFDEFIRKQKFPRRFSKYSAIDGTFTRKILELPTRSWKGIVNCIYE
jgi:dTDP-4-dehydrorhamnose reductase